MDKQNWIPILTALLTIVGGALTFLVGQIFVKLVLEPYIQLKGEIGRIAYSVDYYANQMYGETTKGDEARDIFRQHACRLRELLNCLIFYRFFRVIFQLPSKSDIVNASGQLIGHSNFPKNPNPQFDRSRGD